MNISINKVIVVCLVCTVFFVRLPADPVPTLQVPESFIHFPDEQTQAQIRGEFGGSWRVVETEHFRVMSDSSRRYHCIIAGLLEQFYQEVHPRFFTQPMARIDVYLVNGGKDFEDFVRARGDGDMAEHYGFYKPRDRTFYTRRYFPDGSESGVGTLFHETIHAFVHAEVGDKQVPNWFNEGFASLFEQGRLVKGRWVYGNPNPWREKKFQPEFESGHVPGLKEYFNLTDTEYYVDERSNTNYNTGRSLYLYLLTKLGEPVLQKFVKAVLDGEGGIEAIEGSTGMSLGDIETGWKENVRNMNFGGVYLARADDADALTVLEEGVKLFPDYGMLHLALAESYESADRNLEAQEQAKAALQDPRCIKPQEAYRILGLTYWTSDPPKAIESFQKVVEMQPWVEDVDQASFKNLAELLKFQKNAEGAEQILKQLADILKEDDKSAE